MRIAAAVVVGVLVAGLGTTAEERPDQAVFWKIRQEGMGRSRILPTVHVLTDVYGPRLTGSPNLKAAAEWVIQQMREWGMANAHLEPWDFGHPGWGNDRLVAHMVAPVKDALVVEALSWTPGTNGVVRAPAVQIVLPPPPVTQTDLTSYLEKIRTSILGKVVLVGPHQRVPVTFNPPALRREDADVLALMNAPPAAARGQGPGPQQTSPPPLSNNEVQQQLNQFLIANGVPVRINDAGRDHGQIRAFSNNTYDVAKAPPTVVMRNEDYGRISRLLADQRTVELEFEIVNRTYPEGRTTYNAIAEIPGTDKAGEVVMLGGHLDSWHSATGATDNAIGCTIMMEAARIIATIGVKPRRTIRVALWSGEEQGLLGSEAYVREHFGTFESPKADFDKFSAYFNVDNGTGRIRGFTAFGPPAAAAVLRETASSLKDLGVLGATTTRSRDSGGSDWTSFAVAGLPGINAMLDPIQYQSHTWHTNLDTFERIVEEDAKQSAVVVAAMVYHLAMRDEPLPRFGKDEMPRRPGAPAPASSTGAPARNP
jgi:carboxypeptidase Q